MTSESAARSHVVEAMAWWRLGLSDGRAILAHSATDALVAGLNGDALAELAGIRDDINPFELDALIERVADELGLRADLDDDPAVVAVRRMCRLVLADEMSERELSRWVHDQFHHESESDLLNQLAELDDEYDDAQYARSGTDQIEARIREIAEQILDDDTSQRGVATPGPERADSGGFLARFWKRVRGSRPL